MLNTPVENPTIVPLLTSDSLEVPQIAEKAWVDFYKATFGPKAYIIYAQFYQYLREICFESKNAIFKGIPKNIFIKKKNQYNSIEFVFILARNPQFLANNNEEFLRYYKPILKKLVDVIQDYMEVIEIFFWIKRMHPPEKPPIINSFKELTDSDLFNFNHIKIPAKLDETASNFMFGILRSDLRKIRSLYLKDIFKNYAYRSFGYSPHTLRLEMPIADHVFANETFEIPLKKEKKNIKETQDTKNAE